MLEDELISGIRKIRKLVSDALWRGNERDCLRQIAQLGFELECSVDIAKMASLRQILPVTLKDQLGELELGQIALFDIDGREFAAMPINDEILGLSTAAPCHLQISKTD